MSSSDESSVSYLCPQCQKKLTAQAEDAGQRRECPHCGKSVKVPGTPTQAQARSSKSRSTTPSPSGGIANIPLVCPLCGTRMYATIDQVGKSMVCPDCLESVVVPDRAPPKQQPPKQQPPATSPASQSPHVGVGAASQDDDGDFKLADPIELPRHRSVSAALGDLIDRHAGPSQAGPSPTGPGAPTRGQQGPVPPTPPPPRQFAMKCPVCDTMVQALEEEIGTMKTCPDCFSPMKIARPRPKPRRVNKVVESDYEQDEFVLDEPVALDVYTPTDKSTAPRTVGEEALQKARIARAERERDTPDVPLAPLWTGLFDFLRDSAVITRIVVTGVLLGVTTSFAITVAQLFMSSDPSQQFFGIGGAIVVVVLGIITISYTSINFLTVLQESAEGCKQIENWPENSLADWLTESFTFLMALFFAMIPGMLTVLSKGTTGIPPGIAWLLVGFSVYVFFPVTQLSILESASLANPASRSIIDSLRNDFLLWCTFYVITLFVGLAVAVALSRIRSDHPFWVFIAAGLFLAFIGFLYFRLLGRLAWACQMRPMRKEAEEARKNSSPSERSDK